MSTTIEKLEQLLVDDIKNTESIQEIDVFVEDMDITKTYLSIEDIDDINEKDILGIERIVRSSYEYRTYISYLKNELDLTKCSILPQLDVSVDPVSLEMHHFPLTLFDITEAVTMKLLNESTSSAISMHDIAGRVMEEHFKNNIGIVPLTKTLHEMAHSKSIIITLDKVNGNFENFLLLYKNYINPNVLENIDVLRLHDPNDAKDYNDRKLAKTISHYNVTYE